VDWIECNSQGIVKKISVDKELASSLRGTSKKKYKTAGKLKIDETTASSVISLFYDSLRELLEATAIESGYKIYNHECYCAFLQEILNNPDLGNQFDRFRKIRNSINYYGKDISPGEAKTIKSEIKSLIKKLKRIITI
jgi:hypothetical protein